MSGAASYIGATCAAGENAAAVLPRIGLLGGTFDPPHAGHLALALRFCILLQLDRLLLIPTGHSWQKASNVTPAAHRYAMTVCAADTLRDMLRAQGVTTAVEVSRIEMDRNGPSYTLDTACELRQQWGPHACLIWLMGLDQLQRLHTWNNWQGLLEQMHLCVATRPGYDPTVLPEIVREEVEARCAGPALLQSRPNGLILLDTELAVDLSSTALRHQLGHADGAAEPSVAWPHPLPAAVEQYIRQHRLYQS